MIVGGHDIPEDWESMTCIYNCGYILVWKRGQAFDSGLQMETHIYLEHERPLPTFLDWFRFKRRDN